MNSEEIVTECIKRYPSGSKFSSLTSGGTYISSGDIRIISKDPIKVSMWLLDKSVYDSATVYEYGIWAITLIEIPKIINNYDPY